MPRFVRAWLVDHDIYHDDEKIDSALQAPAEELVPGQHFYLPPINYLNAVTLAALFALGLIAGCWDDIGTLRDQCL